MHFAQAWNYAGTMVASRLISPEPYALTARTAVEIARRVTEGEVLIGFQTPSKVFGAAFITSFDGVDLLEL